LKILHLFTSLYHIKNQISYFTTNRFQLTSTFRPPSVAFISFDVSPNVLVVKSEILF